MSGANRVWVLATLLFAALWLFTLVWAVQHRARPSPPALPSHAAQPPAAHFIHHRQGDLKRALDTGDFGDVADILCAMAQPPAHDLDEVIARLDDEKQRDAIAAMQRARWGDGDGVAARNVMRSAFAKGPHWRVSERPMAPPLPPLYPPVSE